MSDQPFLSVDEVHSLQRLITDARYEARIDEQRGRTHAAGSRLLMIADCEGIIARNQMIVRQQRKDSEATAP